MLSIKIIIYTFIFLTTSAIGILKSKKYVYRVEELKDFKSALNIFKTKLKFTCETIPEIFNQISERLDSNTGDIFKLASYKMQKETACNAWSTAIEIGDLNITSEDKLILKNLSNLLGETDIEGQVNQVELTSNFIEEQIIKAEREKEKNERLFRTLGMTIGLAIVIILM